MVSREKLQGQPANVKQSVGASILSDMPEFNSELGPEPPGPPPKPKSIDMLVELGYEPDDAEKITLDYGVSSLKDSSLADKIKENFAFLQELGYSRDDVIKMTKSLPSIYGLSIDSMKQKIKFYDSIGMHDLAIINTKQLMQGVALSYARYQFFCEKGVAIDISNYRMLFVSQRYFKRKYGYSNDEIKEKYPYEEDKE